MAGNMIFIGRCIGCDRFARLEADVCHDCLTHPKRGRGWADMAHRCRVDPEYSASVYSRIKTDRGREIYRLMFGVPRVP